MPNPVVWAIRRCRENSQTGARHRIVFPFAFGIIKSRRQNRLFPHTSTSAAAMQLNVKDYPEPEKKDIHILSYRDVRLTGVENPRIEVKVDPAEAAKASVLAVARHVRGYDRLPQRRFTHVPLWGIADNFPVLHGRLACATCGVTVEVVPWSSGKRPDHHKLCLVFERMGQAVEHSRKSRGNLKPPGPCVFGRGHGGWPGT